MKIEITTERQPFVNGSRAAKGDIVEVSAAEGKAMISNGFAVEIVEKPKRGRPKKNA